MATPHTSIPLSTLRSILVIDAIVAARYSSPPCEYAEGGDFRATLIFEQI
ncbi:MAG: hypothetical protein ACSI46_05600 [Gloeotrichia echinulata DVL01]|jgi:hypothetical protein|nr:hypothetical protein [Gloeotrichia echinulata DEX184]